MTDRTNYRWSKFVWKDWASDAALRSCSLAARGLWMDLLCLCHDGEPRGYLTIGGRAPSVGEIAKLVAAHHHQVVKLLDELEGRGVFSRTADGVIYSRRQVRDDEQMVASIEWGHRGGNPQLNRAGSKHNGAGRVNPGVSHTVKADSDSGIKKPESPPKRPRRSRSRSTKNQPSRNGFTDSVAADLEATEDAEADYPPSSGATVVPIPRRLVRR